MLPYTVKNSKSQWRCSGDFVVNLEHIYLTHCSSVSIVNFEHVIAGWVCISSLRLEIPFQEFDFEA